MKDASPYKLRRLDAVLDMTGLRRSTVYEQMATGLFPRPVSVGGRIVAWPAHEVQAVIDARIASRADDEIRTLVSRLATDRHS